MIEHTGMDNSSADIEHVWELFFACRKIEKGGRMKIEKDLVESAQNGDKQAFSELYSKIYVDLYKFACFMMGNAHEAEDVAADAVLDIYTQLRKLRGTDKFKSWAFAIVANKCKKRMRKRKSMPISLDEGLEGVFLDTQTAGADMEVHIEKMDAGRAYKDLDKEERMIVSLSVFGGYHSSEIGEILNMNHNTVRSKLSRALGKMRERLEE